MSFSETSIQRHLLMYVLSDHRFLYSQKALYRVDIPAQVRRDEWNEMDQMNDPRHPVVAEK